MKRMISFLLALTLLMGAALAESTAETGWYEEKARALADDVYALCSDESFLDMLGITGKPLEHISQWAQAIEQGELSVERDAYTAERALVSRGMLTLPAAYRRSTSVGQVVSSLIAGQLNQNVLAAGTAVHVSMGYLMPEDFAPCDVTFHYEGLDIVVFFAQYGEGVVRGEAFVIVPDEE